MLLVLLLGPAIWPLRPAAADPGARERYEAAPEVRGKSVAGAHLPFEKNLRDAKHVESGRPQFQDLQVLQSTARVLEFVLSPQLLRADLEPGGALSLGVRYAGGEERPRRRLRVALPPHCEPVVEVLSSRLRDMPGPLKGAGFRGENPGPLVQQRRHPYGDLDCLTLSVDLLRYNGEVTRILERIELRIRFDRPEGLPERGRVAGVRTRIKDRELRAVFVNHREARNWGGRGMPLRGAATSWDGDTWLRIPVLEEGLYRILSEHLSQLGLDPAALDPRAFKLYSYGGRVIDEDPEAPRNGEFSPRELPLLRELDGEPGFGDPERLLFYGRGTQGLVRGGDGAITHYDHYYTDENVYYLLLGGQSPGREMTELASQAGEGETPSLVERPRWRAFVDEQKNLTKNSVKYWFGDEFTGLASHEYDFIGPWAGATELRLDFDFWVENSVTSEKMHFELNGAQVGADEVGAHHSQLTDSLQIEGGTLGLELSQVATAGHRVLLDWLEISYPAPPAFVEGELCFESPSEPGLYTYQVADFPAGAYVLDVTWPDSVRAGRAASFTDRVAPEQPGGETGLARVYYGCTEQALRDIGGQSLDHMPDLKSDAGTSELIVIAPEDLAAPAEELVQFKNSSTATGARLALLEDVYREFNCGVTDPGAVRNFLRHELLAAPENPASYVLVVGNGHFDYRGLIAGGWELRFPAWYSGSRMIDDYFVRLQDEDVVDVALGRLPANSEQEVYNYVEKLMTYEQGEDTGFWRNRMLFVADDEHGENGSVFSFEMTHSEDTEDLLSRYAPRSFDIERIYSFEYPSVYNPEIRVFEKPLCEQRLLNALNEGAMFVSFMGHGNNTTWTHEYIFNSTKHFHLLDTSRRPSLYAAATCSWAEIDLPVGLAFPQQLINLPGGGAIGVMAASRKTTGNANYSFMRDLLPAFFAHFTDGSEQVTLAEAMRIAKNEGGDSNRDKYLYLGDPSLLPAFPSGEGAVVGVRGADGEERDTLLSHEAALVSARTYAGESADPGDVDEGEARVHIREAPIPRRHDYDPYTPTQANPDPEYHGRFLEYEQPGPLLFAGSIPVENAGMDARFVVPADVSGSTDPGRVRMYYQGQTLDGALRDGLVYDEGIRFARNPDPPEDHDAPWVEIYFNGPQWRPDDWLAPNSQVVVQLEDSSGINLTGEVGHRIELQIDGGLPIDLTPHFVYDFGSWTRGAAALALPALEAGDHSVQARAFDNFNNPGYGDAEFRLLDQGPLSLSELVAFPNPVKERAQFTFRLRGAELDPPPPEVEVSVYTVRGRRVFRDRLDLSGSGGLLWTEEWRAADGRGDPLARGVYFYRLRLEVPQFSYSLVDELGGLQTRTVNARSLEATGRMIVE